MNWRDLLKSNALKFLAGGFVVGAICLLVGQVIFHATGTAAFCGNCHSMKSEAATFAMNSHRNLDCTECHLPHDNTAIYLIEKGRTGLVDMYHEVLRDYPEKIILSEDSRMMVRKNCQRCHGATMSYVAEVGIGETNQDCLKCHSRVAHGSNHLEGGIEIK